MYLINAHVLPSEDRKNKDEQIIGAYASLFIDYKDIDGAFELAKYYIQQDDWNIDELEKEYFILNSPDDVEMENIQFYNEAVETGYSLLFSTYKNDDDDDDDDEVDSESR